MDEAVRHLLSTRWGLRSAIVEGLSGPGICSETWRVFEDGDRWVAKAVPALDGSTPCGIGFEDGLEIAEALAKAGFRTGVPKRSVRGALVEPLGDWNVALLRLEEGRRFSVTDLDEAKRLGEHLAEIHRELQGASWGHAGWDPIAEFVDQPYVALRPGLADLAVEVVQAALKATAGSTTGLIHGDLDADEILIASDETIAIVDWGSVRVAPLVLDILPFHDHECFPALVSGYTMVRPEAKAELRPLAELERLHWLRQTAFWGGRVLAPFRDAERRQGFPNEYGFERSYEILTTGRWRP